MRWLRKACIALGRWWVRQAAALVVIACGMFIGWWIRKGTGPPLVSESFSRTKPPASVPQRPGPLTPRDPVVAGFAAEFASLAGPSGTLLRLQADLAASRITDFEALATSLLSHPLPHFRKEALRSVLTAWGRKDPGGALRFLDDYREEADDLGRDGSNLRMASRIALDWARQDPVAALEFLKRPSGDGEVTFAVIEAVLSQGSVVKRLRLLEDTLGEAAVERHLQRWPGRIPQPSPTPRPSSADWQALAVETRSAKLAARYVGEALVQRLNEAATPPSTAEAVAWLTEIVPSGLRGHIKWQAMPVQLVAALLPTLSPEELRFAADKRTWADLQARYPEAVLGFLEQNGSGWMPAQTFRGLGSVMARGTEQGWAELVGAATDAAQRTELGLGLVSGALSQQGRDGASALLIEEVARRVAGLGQEGEPALAALLGGLRGNAAVRVPELFANLPPEFQADRRMEVVAQMARWSSPIAAELWLGASPDELAQPGAAAVPALIAENFLGRDSEAASDWIGRLPLGVARDRAVAVMIERTAERDPQTCAEWAATIEDPAALKRATHALDFLARRRAPSYHQ